MIGAVHAIIGACVGSFFEGKTSAFAAGVASHAAADSLPHKDLTPATETPLLIGAVSIIAAIHGTHSPEFWGAIGATCPDIEHALPILGITKPHQKIFPTHIENGKYHGQNSNERLSQLIIAAAAIAITALNHSEN